MTYESRKYLISISEYYESYKNIFLFMLKILISGGIILFIFHFIDPASLIRSFLRANILFLLIAFILLALNIYAQFRKWELTCNYTLNEFNRKKIFFSLFYGFAAGSFTPARIGEYFGRNIALKNKSILKVTTATLVEKFFPLLIVAFSGSISSILFLIYYYRIPYYITFALFILLFAVFYFLFFLLANPAFWNNFLFEKIKNSPKVYKYLSPLSSLRNLDSKYLAKMLLYSTLFVITFLIQFTFLMSAFSNNFLFVKYIWAASLIMFSKSFVPPVSIGEIGVREGISIFYLTQMGELSSTAFDAAIFLFLINILIPALIGMFLMFGKHND